MKNKKRKSTEEKIDIITEGLELGWVETARRQNISYPTLQNWRSLNEALGCGVASVEALLDGLTKADCNNAYAPGKWTLKEVLLHCIDAKRVFTYRTLLLLRGNTTPLAGYDQDPDVPAL